MEKVRWINRTQEGIKLTELSSVDFEETAKLLSTYGKGAEQRKLHRKQQEANKKHWGVKDKYEEQESRKKEREGWSVYKLNAFGQIIENEEKAPEFVRDNGLLKDEDLAGFSGAPKDTLTTERTDRYYEEVNEVCEGISPPGLSWPVKAPVILPLPVDDCLVQTTLAVFDGSSIAGVRTFDG